MKNRDYFASVGLKTPVHKVLDFILRGGMMGGIGISLFSPGMEKPD
jgi:hypothetical protein